MVAIPGVNPTGAVSTFKTTSSIDDDGFTIISTRGKDISDKPKLPDHDKRVFTINNYYGPDRKSVV